jgi:hypothetical protein
MYGIMKSFGNFFLKSYSYLVAFLVIAMSGLAMAQTGGGNAATITVTKPDINWGTVASDLVAALTSVVIVGLGIAISVWVLMLVARVFKRSAS